MTKKYRISFLNDRHTHASLYSAVSDHPNIQDCKNAEEAMQVIRSLNDDLAMVLGWNSQVYPLDRAELNRLPPRVIGHLSLHSFIMNDAAKDALRNTHLEVTENIDDPIWVEKRLPDVLSILTTLKPLSAQKIRRFYGSLEDLGVWQVADMLLPDDTCFNLMRECDVLDRTQLWAEPERFESFGKAVQKEVRGIKIFTDGAIATKAAANREKYLTGERGFLLYSNDELKERTNKAKTYDKAVAIHAIGDLAIEQVVTVLGELKEDGVEFEEARIEHAQFITKEAAQEAKRLGITLCMQPNFNTDSTTYKDRLSQEYQANNNPFRMLIDEIGFVPGEDLIFGSDGMPHGAEYALQASLFPAFPGQKLTVDEFRRGYCLENEDRGYIEFSVEGESVRDFNVVRREI